MSYRPTISVYINGKIVDNGYYRNWRDKDLFYEAVTIAAFFGDCKTREEYYDKMYGTQKVIHVFEPEVFESTEENLKWFEEVSEFPVIVDLTEKYIYASYDGVLSGKVLKERPTVTTDRRIICSKEVRKKLRTEKCDYWDYIRYGSNYDNGYVYVNKTIQRIGVNSPDEDFTAILNKCKISFAHWDMVAIRSIIMKWGKAKYHMSKSLLNSIKHPAYIRNLEESR